MAYETSWHKSLPKCRSSSGNKDSQIQSHLPSKSLNIRLIYTHTLCIHTHTDIEQSGANTEGKRRQKPRLSRGSMHLTKYVLLVPCDVLHTYPHPPKERRVEEKFCLMYIIIEHQNSYLHIKIPEKFYGEKPCFSSFNLMFSKII